MKSIFLNRLNQYLLIPLVLILLMSGFSEAKKIHPLHDRVLVTFDTSKGIEQSFEIIALTHEVVSPRDAASGLPTGKRQHKPVNITKEVDKSSPILGSLFHGTDNFTYLRIEFVRASKKRSRPIKTITLDGANVCGMKNAYSSSGEGIETEKISLCYQSITWTWHTEDGDKVIEDTWKQPEE